MDSFDKLVQDLETHFSVTNEKSYGCGAVLIIRPDFLTLIEGINKLREENKQLKTK